MDTKNDIFGWFPAEHEEILGKLIKEQGIDTVLEIGSFIGRSTRFFAQRVQYVTAIDPFKAWTDKDRPNGDTLSFGDDFFDKFRDNMIAADVWGKIYAIRDTSRNAIESFYPRLKVGYDLIYIDGLHDYDSVRFDLEHYAPLAKKVLCGDDYDENWLGVRKAVDEMFGDRVKVFGRVWYVIL